MKIYGYFERMTSSNTIDDWTGSISEQAKETIDILFEQYDNNPEWWHHDLVFPYFIQNDTRARWIIKDDKRFYLVDPAYTLLFLWETEDFSLEVGEDSHRLYAKYMEKAGLKNDSEIKVPDGFIYLGRYIPNVVKLELPGLKIDEEFFKEEGTEILDDCMLTDEECK